MQIERIKTDKLTRNSGQIEGLPKNPRKWDAIDIERLADSIRETPLMIEARPLLVYPHKGKYVVLGGNARLEALRKAGMEEAPCVIFDEGTPTTKLKEIVLKDNSSYGEWDTDELANKWNHVPLSQWGVDLAGLNEGASYTGTNKEVDTDSWREDMVLKLRFTLEEMEWVQKRMQGKDARREILTALGYYGES